MCMSVKGVYVCLTERERDMKCDTGKRQKSLEKQVIQSLKQQKIKHKAQCTLKTFQELNLKQFK